MLKIDRDDVFRRFDELFEVVNGPAPKGERPAPDSEVLRVLCFMDLTAAEGLFLANLHGADEFYRYAEIRGGRFVLQSDYRRFELKDAKLRRENRTAWRRMFKEKTSPPKAEKVKKPRAPRKRKAVSQ